MKTLIFSLLAIGTLALSSCKENKEQKSTTETSMQHDMSMMSDNSAMGDMPMDEKVTVIDAKKNFRKSYRTLFPLHPSYICVVG